jgi:D-serine deaminase-like pyridoxal phosphate-dependent protein
LVGLKPHRFGFYTKANLRRLWRQIRGADPLGCTAQSCHLTDPQHPHHIAVGAKAGATAQETPAGSDFEDELML